jgi:tRNA-guanine transglycosylase
MLLSEHNIHFLVNMMKNIRKAIEEDRFLEYKREFYNKYGEF